LFRIFVSKYQNNSVNSCQVPMMGNMVWLVPTNNALNYVATEITKLTCQQHILLHCKVIKTVNLRYNISYPLTLLTVSLRLTVNLTWFDVWLWLWNSKVSIQFHYIHKTSFFVLGWNCFLLVFIVLLVVFVILQQSQNYKSH
jgi:hypothetical protein